MDTNLSMSTPFFNLLHVNKFSFRRGHFNHKITIPWLFSNNIQIHPKAIQFSVENNLSLECLYRFRSNIPHSFAHNLFDFDCIYDWFVSYWNEYFEGRINSSVSWCPFVGKLHLSDHHLHHYHQYHHHRADNLKNEQKQKCPKLKENMM